MVFKEGRYPDGVLERVLHGDKRLGSRDRRFIASTFYDMIRYWRHVEALEQVAGIAGNTDYFLKVAHWLLYTGHNVTEWEELAHLPANFVEEASKYINSNTAIAQSIPDWLHELGQQQLPQRWETELAALNGTAPTYLRTNTLKTNREELLDILQMEGVPASPMPTGPHTIRLDDKTNVIRLGSFRKGLYEVQDASSQLIAPTMQPQPGQTVIDACAGAGGKTLHLAMLMENEGHIIAMDVEAWKLRELEKRARRAGITIIETIHIEGPKTINRLETSADALLLDVPCSGLGILRRNPFTKWHLTPDNVEHTQGVQASILDKYTEMLRPGGTLLYATCSILPQENQDQVSQFLSAHPEYVLETSHHTWPSEGMDGFFMARIKKEAEAE